MMTFITAAAPIAILNELFNVAALVLAQSPSQLELAITCFAGVRHADMLAGCRTAMAATGEDRSNPRTDATTPS
jgi:hypothetical protein